MSGSHRRRPPSRAAWLLPLGALLTATCFSEEPQELTAPAEGECRIAVGSPVVGIVGVVVALRDFSFVPQEVRVPRGTRVTWVNCEQANIDFHTTTSDTGTWDSPAMTAGDSYSRVFDQAGRFPYHCTPHASFMRGIIVVE